MARDIEVIWVNREWKYFCKWGWTAELPNSLSGKSADLSAIARTGGSVTRIFIVVEWRITLRLVELMIHPKN